MRWLALVCVAVAWSLTGVAEAESWTALTELLPNSDPLCPALIFDFPITISGNEITIVSGRGPVTGPIAGDGSFKLSYGGAFGSTVISGNARTKELRFAARELSKCAYSLNPMPPGVQIKEWKVTVLQVSANSGCAGGIRGRVRETATALNLYAWLPIPALGPPLKQDGSAEMETRTSWGNNSSARIKIPAGSGPRKFEFYTVTNVCRYRVEPD